MKVVITYKINQIYLQLGHHRTQSLIVAKEQLKEPRSIMDTYNLIVSIKIMKFLSKTNQEVIYKIINHCWLSIRVHVKVQSDRKMK